MGLQQTAVEWRRSVIDKTQVGTRRRAISAATLSSARKALPDSRMACASYMPALAVACAVHDLSRCDASGGCCSADSTSVYSAAACFAILQIRAHHVSIGWTSWSTGLVISMYDVCWHKRGSRQHLLQQGCMPIAILTVGSP